MGVYSFCASETEGKKQNYLAYLYDRKPIYWLCKEKSKIYIVAKTEKFTMTVGVVPTNVDAIIRPLMEQEQFIFINSTKISRTAGANYTLSVNIGWYDR